MSKQLLFSQIHKEKCWPLLRFESPCENACPLHTSVPDYVMAISQGKFRDALNIIRETNPLPSVCGWVCDHPCEQVCNRAIIDEPIAIKWLKRLAVEQGDCHEPQRFRQSNREKVAIIGSGPAGITAAYDLVKNGYSVTVFEALSLPGGMLTNAIPEFILPKEIAEADIRYIEKSGVHIVTNYCLGRDFAVKDLLNRGFNSVLVATGAQKNLMLNIHGSELQGVFPAIHFLQSVRSGEKMALKGKVVIIGGGDVAIDVARVALRIGAQEVQMACLESIKNMPAHKWEIDIAMREGIRIHPSLAPQRFKGHNTVTSVDFKRVLSTHIDEKGKLTWQLAEDSASDYAMEANTVIVAIGQTADYHSLGVALKAASASEPSVLVADIPGVFAAGDVAKGTGTVAKAMASGRQAAECIRRYLQGETFVQSEPKLTQVANIEKDKLPSFITKKHRWEMPEIKPMDAIRTLRPATLGYSPWQGIEEASRCLNCKMCYSCIVERNQLCFETADRIL